MLISRRDYQYWSWAHIKAPLIMNPTADATLTATNDNDNHNEPCTNWSSNNATTIWLNPCKMPLKTVRASMAYYKIYSSYCVSKYRRSQEIDSCSSNSNKIHADNHRANSNMYWHHYFLDILQLSLNINDQFLDLAFYMHSIPISLSLPASQQMCHKCKHTWLFLQVCYK